MTSLKTSIKTITYLSDIGCLEIQGSSLTCAHTHACRKNRACAFLAGFRVVCCLFYRFPVRNALRASQAVLITDVMVNQSHLHCYSEPERNSRDQNPRFFSCASASARRLISACSCSLSSFRRRFSASRAILSSSIRVTVCCRASSFC